MKSVLCCILAYLTGSALLNIESIWADLAGLVALPAILAWPVWLAINRLIPLPQEDTE